MATGLFVEIQTHGTIAAGGSNARATVNTFHYKAAAIGVVPTKAQIDTPFQAQVVVPLGLALSVRWTQVFNTVRFFDDALDPPVSFSHAVAGAIAGDSLPMTNTVYMLLRTGFKGRRYRGNKKFGPIAESDTTTGTDDILNAAALVRWGAVVTGINGNLLDGAGNVWVPIVLSRQSPSQLLVNPTNVVFSTVLSTTLRKSIGRLRRREAKSVY
jgi:hypothetical protein